jgi:hypothetical protein
VPFLEFGHDGGRTDGQHACGIPHAAGIQGHIDHLLFHLRGLPRVGLRQEKRPPASQATRPASVTVLAFSGHAMAHIPGHDHVRRNAIRRYFFGQRTRKTNQPGLGSAIGRVTWPAHEPNDRGDVDNAPTTALDMCGTTC